MPVCVEVSTLPAWFWEWYLREHKIFRETKITGHLNSDGHPQDNVDITWQIIYVHLKFICFEQREMNPGIKNTFACSVFFIKYLVLVKAFGQCKYWFTSPKKFWEVCQFSFSKTLLCMNTIIANSYSTAIFLHCQTCPEPHGCICLKAETQWSL